MYEKQYLISVAGMSPIIDEGTNSYNDAFRKAEAWAKETPGINFVIYQAITEIAGSVTTKAINLKGTGEAE